MQTASFHLLPLLFGNVVVTTGQFCSWEHQMAQTICLQRPCGRWLRNQMQVPGGLLTRWLVLLQSLSFGFLVSKVGLVVTTSWNRLAIRFSDFSVHQIHSRAGSTHCWLHCSFHTIRDALECMFLPSFYWSCQMGTKLGNSGLRIDEAGTLGV